MSSNHTFKVSNIEEWGREKHGHHEEDQVKHNATATEEKISLHGLGTFQTASKGSRFNYVKIRNARFLSC